MKVTKIDYSKLSVFDGAEVVVCGGGTSGAFAAIAAAQEGRDVLLIEQFGMLGGSATAGLVSPVMRCEIDGNPQCSYISEILRGRLISRNACTPDGCEFDPLILKIVLEEMCAESGVRLMYYTFIPDVVIEDGRISAVVIANKAGLSLIKGKIFIDCTGDGDVCVYAGAEYSKGDPETGMNQPMSLRYMVGGVDIEALGAFFEQQKALTGIDIAASTNADGWLYAHCCKGKPVTLTTVFETAVANGDLTQEDHYYWQCYSVTGRPGCVAFNCPEFFENIDGTSVRDLTLAQINGKKAILRQLDFYRKYFKGFENAYISEIAPMVGVRESREIQTDYVLCAEDLYFQHKFADMFCQSNYPIDIHGKVLNSTLLDSKSDDGKPWYEIPYRCLLVKNIDNLLVAGRCIGADYASEASIRVQQTARSSGEASGIGAAMALQKNISPHDVNGADVRRRMVEKGAIYAK